MTNNPFVIAVSGGIGSGKTTVADLFGDYGITIIDADIVARDVVAAGSDGLSQIVAHFGQTILLDNGELHRAKLREIIFNKTEEKAWLEQLTHPLIQQRTTSLIAQSHSAYTLYVTPLLAEKGVPSWVDRVLIVDCEESLQLTRAMARDNNTSSLIQSIIANQASRKERLSIADDVIHNNGNMKHLQEQVAHLHQTYLSAIESRL